MKGEAEAGKLTEEQKKVLSDLYKKLSDPANFPKLEAEQLGQSAEGGVTTDPALRSAQMNALNKMKDIEDSGGLTLADMAAQKKTTDMANRSASAMHQKVLEGMARRGVGGSGAELVANLQANQDSAERANEAGMASAASAQKRYYDSIMGRAKMAGDLRGQDFDQNSRTARAKDLREQYNAGNRTDANKYNARLPVELAGMQSGAAGPLAGFYGKEAQGKRDFWSGMGVAGKEFLTDRSGGGGSGGGSGGGYSAPPMVDSAVGYDSSGTPYYSDPDDWSQWSGE